VPIEEEEEYVYVSHVSAYEVSILIFSVALLFTSVVTFRCAWVQFGLPLTFIPHALQPAHPLTPPQRTLKQHKGSHFRYQ
jgi:hypothetical protein